MIKFENTEVVGFEHAIRGMRNPMNSWDNSDSRFNDNTAFNIIGQNDLSRMKKLSKAGPEHRKFMRMIIVYVDITAPLYWWKEFDTYKVGTVANSCSTMHKIQAKEFTLDDFSHEHLLSCNIDIFNSLIDTLNLMRDNFNDYDKLNTPCYIEKKDYWWQMIQLLPSSYNQKRTVMLNYEVLANIYKPDSRLHHKLDEWNVECEGSFCKWIETLPHSELITGKEN